MPVRAWGSFGFSFFPRFWVCDVFEVQEKIATFGFDPELSKILDKIESEFIKGPDEFDFKSCIGHARTFQEHLFKSVVKEVEGIKNITYNWSSTNTVDLFVYLKKPDINFLNGVEFEFVKILWGFASEEGVHTLSADYAGARIIKNIVIELALFILERLGNYE